MTSGRAKPDTVIAALAGKSPPNNCPQFRHPRCVTRIDQEYGHSDDILQLAAGFGQRPLDVAEYLMKLRIEIAGQRAAVVRCRAGMSRNPNNRLLAFCDDSRRK